MFDLFSYKNGYRFDELQKMSDQFDHLRLPFLKAYDVKRLLGEYIFGISMKRFPVGRKNTLRRFLGGLFEYGYETEGAGESLFIFTGDRKNRPDYIQSFKKVAAQCDNAMIIVLNREKLHFKPWKLYGVLPELIWACRIKSIVKQFYISFDMAVALFRSLNGANAISKIIGNAQPELVTVFCDAWSVENAIVQKLSKQGVKTATLQHGNGTDIFLGTCSDMYLANSLLSKQNAIRCGVDEKHIAVVGPMKYAGETFSFNNHPLKTIGVVFDGAQNLENNIEMIDVIHAAINEQQCFVRFHPNNRRDQYAGHVLDSDVVCDSLEEFENSIDLCIVYNSSMYTDMIYKRIPVVRFKNDRVDLFPELKDRGFTSEKELQEILKSYETEEFRLYQDELYCKVYGQHCGRDSYRDYYQSILKEPL